MYWNYRKGRKMKAKDIKDIVYEGLQIPQEIKIGKVSVDLDNLEKIVDKISIRVEQQLLTNVLAAFERYLRSRETYAVMGWNEKETKEYLDDKRYALDVYQKNRTKKEFGDAYNLAEKLLFIHIIKETFDFTKQVLRKSR